MSKALAGARRRGREDYENGVKLADCPYRDKRTAGGSVTFSRAFVKAWLEGWQEARKEAREQKK